MNLEHCVPLVPTCTNEVTILVVAILGTILLIYSQFVEAEHRRDVIRMLGAAGLFVYSYFVADKIFMVASAGIFLAALVEFIEILLGLHRHKREDITRYKKMK